MKESKFSRPPAPGVLIALRSHADDDRGILFENGFELPSSCTYEPMCRSLGIICLGPKPGETNGNPTSDRLTIRPPRFRAQKKHLVVARRLPRGYLCTVQVHLALAKGRSYLDSRNRAISFANAGDPRNSEPAV